MSVAPSTPLGSVPDDLTEHYRTVVRELLKGRVTPVLGVGASLYGRALSGSNDQAEADLNNAQARPSSWDGAPSADELAAYLAREFEIQEGPTDLLRVAQWIYALRGGSGGLYATLHEVFDRDFPRTRLHDALAQVPRRLREASRGKPPLIVTTNYDDLMERALEAEGEEYDLVVYMAEGELEGTFCERLRDGTLDPIRNPQSHLTVDPDKRTVILKLHGFVSRREANDDSYVITEDHYIEYLTRTDLTKLLPAPVMARLLNCHLLFLGYSLRDWNLRAILHQLYQRRRTDNDWWAVRLSPDRLESKSWEKRKVEIIDMALEEYIPALEAVLIDKLHRSAEQGLA